MKNSDFFHHNNKRSRFSKNPCSSSVPGKKFRFSIIDSVSVHIETLNIPLISTATNSTCDSIRLYPYKPFTIGRNRNSCEFVFEDRRISNQHCQFLSDSQSQKVCITDGVFVNRNSLRSSARVSLNGVFVNGVRIGRGEVVELSAGDVVSLVCGNDGGCSSGIGFLVKRIVFMEEIFDLKLSTGCESGAFSDGKSPCGGIVARGNWLLNQCRQILSCDDPIWCIRNCVISGSLTRTLSAFRNGVNNYPSLISSNGFKADGSPGLNFDSQTRIDDLSPIKGLASDHNTFQLPDTQKAYSVISREDTDDIVKVDLQQLGSANVPVENGIFNDLRKDLSAGCVGGKDVFQPYKNVLDKNRSVFVPSPGKKLYLNRLEAMEHGSVEHCSETVSLSELFYPVENLVRVFIATFTSDILWFLSYCQIPATLPVTLACHNAERCWSSNLDKRTFVPYSDFPNLVAVYPPFPEVIAFGKDRKKLGIACHHPKLLVLQREDSIRVIITSANLVAKQWHRVTNTVWWQDFCRASSPDYLSLFTQSADEDGEVNQDSVPDFAAQLAGFIASLVADVPSQAHWILELAKYDFKGAEGYLVSSVPGIFSRITHISKCTHFLTVNSFPQQSWPVKLLGSVETSVVGLSHLFRTSADSRGRLLKKLAIFLEKCHENAHGMSEIVLRRNTNIAADVNAVSVLIPNPQEVSQGDCIQLGFLPRNVAKWVAPLSDTGLFSFSACIYPREILATALEGSNSKVQLILYVSQGPKFADMSKLIQPEHVSAICLLVASIQRYTGLWRLHEVLSRYNWPEQLETDFTFGSSSIGAVNAPFLAAFSAAAGKRSLQLSESEESDPDWGCWSSSQELRNPSIKIIFPTIERVKSASCGILASKHLLCFSQKTWQRLRNISILHDAIPYPNDRIGHPMHVKVARRRFQSKVNSSSFGWVYSGSHNFSAAAWGRPMKIIDSDVKTNSVLGSRLHICNYELGIIFVVPPYDSSGKNKLPNLDDITLPFFMPAPKYRPRDRPATAQAMKEALYELAERERRINFEVEDTENVMEEEMVTDEEEEVLEANDYVVKEKEEEKAYAETLWSQVDESQSS